MKGWSDARNVIFLVQAFKSFFAVRISHVLSLVRGSQWDCKEVDIFQWIYRNIPDIEKFAPDRLLWDTGWRIGQTERTHFSVVLINCTNVKSCNFPLGKHFIWTNNIIQALEFAQIVYKSIHVTLLQVIIPDLSLLHFLSQVRIKL